MSTAQNNPNLRWQRFRHALANTRARFTDSLANLLLGARKIDPELLDQLETSLLTADVGVKATATIMEKLSRRVARKELNDGKALFDALRHELIEVLSETERTFSIDGGKPYVILIVGVNGVGKTTTIGKLANRLQSQGHSVLLAAGDTFRAAAIEQLQSWGESLGVPVVAHRMGSDSASVIYDAIESAKARKIDVVIADTAGRLHNKIGLMDELAKLKRVIKRLDAEAPHDIVLVLDATVGQNATAQLEEFDRTLGLTGLAVAKLDGTAKAGVIIGLAASTAKPIYFVGLGEGPNDLQPFDAAAFTDGLLANSP